MGKKKAKEPETPAKDEVSYYAQKSTYTVKLMIISLLIALNEIDFLQLFEVLGNLRVLLKSFIHDKITQSTIKLNHFVIFLSALELAAKQNGSL